MKRLITLLLLLACTPALADEAADDFARANGIFEASVSLLGKDDRSAAQGLRRSALMFETLASEHGAESSDIYTNAANARLLAGDTGHAIALYHRALRLDPTDANARANLGVARARARADVSIENSTGALETLTAWRLYASPRTRTTIALSAWGALWFWAALRAAGAPAGRWTYTALPCAVVVLVAGLSLVADSVASRESIGVVVAGETVGRTGPDAAVYDPSFTKALPEGVEFVVIDQRAGWVLGRLGDGRETWIEQRDVELVGV